jgi:hypothetical protein
MRSSAIKILLLLFCSIPVGIGAQENNALSYFYAKQIGDSVVLSFEMRAGVTCNGIGIQRRVGEQSADYVGFIAGVCGNEESAESYIFVDANPIKNQRLYYRLFLGEVGFSQEIEVFVPEYLEAGYTLAIEPNSQQWAIYFRNPLDNDVLLEIYSASGQLKTSLSTTINYFVLPDWILRNELYFFRLSIKGRDNQIMGKFFLN